MTFQTRRKLRLVFAVGAAAAGVGILLANLQQGRWNFESTMNGIVDGVLVGSVLAAYHFFVYDGGRSRAFQPLNFVQTLLVNTTAYTLAIIGARTAGRLVMGQYSGPLAALSDPFLAQTTMSVLGLSLIANLIFQVSTLIGPGELWRFVTGRYHRPRLEQRVFLFIDLVSSTAIAQQIGPTAFLRLLDAFYRDMSEPILRTGAQVYKYVGDEIILTWSAARASSECFRFIAYVDAQLIQHKPAYVSQFGLFPTFRAALHGGEVVSGEMGVLKKEIAYMGDVLNTTARLLEACRKLERKFLCSDVVVSMLGPLAGVALRPLGSATLRGRAAPLGLLTFADSSETGPAS